MREIHGPTICYGHSILLSKQSKNVSRGLCISLIHVPSSVWPSNVSSPVGMWGWDCNREFIRFVRVQVKFCLNKQVGHAIKLGYQLETNGVVLLSTRKNDGGLRESKDTISKCESLQVWCYHLAMEVSSIAARKLYISFCLVCVNKRIIRISWSSYHPSSGSFALPVVQSRNMSIIKKIFDFHFSGSTMECAWCGTFRRTDINDVPMHVQLFT